MPRNMYPDDAEKKNRGFLGFDSSALPPRDRQVSLLDADTALCVCVCSPLTNTCSQDRQQLRYELDLNSWNLRIWGVAASGFLTDS